MRLTQHFSNRRSYLCTCNLLSRGRKGVVLLINVAVLSRDNKFSHTKPATVTLLEPCSAKLERGSPQSSKQEIHLVLGLLKRLEYGATNHQNL